jgi:type I restriction enzyme M protein
LKLFLKYINEFEYSHSEKLGDAFEYLLSVMGSQGDAGQFRTPRHIIDFVTACVNPQKNETVLDPACGTAGFLLSAYKHILHQNTDKRVGDLLKPDDRKKLATHFVGYDISPDMVRLSLANMYLHGFTTPNIVEYDTLSSEDRWNETFDVILANPPFMTPKGGIRPHKKFGVQANKAEVLFTDYIAEHLNSNGRAGIVVPNGIVATSQTAYKQLRKMLVQDSLIAVISLPAGVFQPYSGVKTSVLILDKRLAKKSQQILFLKIENDGFDLGAQRREIDKNDLPVALQTLEAFKECLNNDKAFEEFPQMAIVVEKSFVLNNKDVVLSPDRYREAAIINTEYPVVKLSELIKIQSGFAFDSKLFNEDNGFPLIRIRDIKTNKTKTKYSGEFKEDFIVKNGDLIIGMDGEFNRVIWQGNDALLNQRVCRIIEYKNCYRDYIFRMIEKPLQEIEDDTIAVTVKHISVKQILDIEIPLPPLEIQQQIVAEIEGYQKVIDGAKQVVNNYKPTITINPDWEMVELDFLCDKITDGSHFSPDTVTEGFPYVTVRDVDESKIDLIGCKKINEKAYLELVKSGCKPKLNDVLFSKDGTVGKVSLVDFEADFVVLSSLAIISPNLDLILPSFLSFILQSDYALSQAINLKGGVAIKRVVLKDLKTIKIPKISFEEQQTIVKAIEEELQLVNASKRLVEIFEQKIKTKIGEVWGVKDEVETV